MGYDMYWRVKPPEIKKAYEEAIALFKEAADIRDEKKKLLGEHDLVLFNNAVWKDVQLPKDASPALKAAFSAQKEVLRLHKEAYEKEEYYFRLNIWSMGLCRQIMSERGMMNEHASVVGAYPKEKDFGAFSEDEMEWVYDRSLPMPDNPMLAAYAEAIDSFLGQEASPVSGIPYFKVGSNDGWIVTPSEIEIALANMSYGEELPTVEEGPVEWWPSWIDFMRRAMEHGGFVVW